MAEARRASWARGGHLFVGVNGPGQRGGLAALPTGDAGLAACDRVTARQECCRLPRRLGQWPAVACSSRRASPRPVCPKRALRARSGAGRAGPQGGAGAEEKIAKAAGPGAAGVLWPWTC